MDMGFIGGIILIALLNGPAAAREVLVWLIIAAVCWGILKGLFALIDWIGAWFDEDKNPSPHVDQKFLDDVVNDLRKRWPPTPH